MNDRVHEALTLAFLAAFPRGEWSLAPPCFTPNPLCLDQIKRGLLEIEAAENGRAALRLTDKGRALFASRPDGTLIPPVVTYQGKAKTRRVEVVIPPAGVTPGAKAALPMRHDLANHSPDGFNWGYAGSGPAQLALAITAHALGNDAIARQVYQHVKAELIAVLDGEADFILTRDAVLRVVQETAR